MYTFDFSVRLRELNPRLYVDTRAARSIHGEWSSAGIYLQNPERKQLSCSRAETAYAKDGGQKYLLDIADGVRDEFICGVSLNWVPEYDIYECDPQSGLSDLVAPGWRGLLVRMARRGHIKLDAARRLFRCQSLGDQPYDRMNFEQRRALADQERLKRGDQYSIRL